MAEPRFLIVNADGFGASEAVNRGVIEAHRAGIVTSASLMVRGEAAEHAADLADDNPALALGLHLDLAEYVRRDGIWRASYIVVALGNAEAVAGELERQLAAFIGITGRHPDHVDSHQDVHLVEPVRGIVVKAAARLGIGVRSLSPQVSHRTPPHRGDQGADLTAEGLIEVIRALPPGWSELGCRPGYADNLRGGRSSRSQLELEAICDPRVTAEIRSRGVVLSTWANAAVQGRSPASVLDSPLRQGWEAAG